MSSIKKIIELHKFFVKTTPSYVGNNDGKLSIKAKLYYPIAYIKFMYYSLFD